MEKTLITLSPNAIDRVRSVLSQNADKFLKLSTKNAGCSGFKYNFTMVDEIEKSDILVSIEDFNIYIDTMALMYVIGTHVDWVENGLNHYFDFINPNETARCGCGESFSVKACA